MKAIRVCTICHNDDDSKDKDHRRVRVVLHKGESGYRWYVDGEGAGLPVYDSVREAQRAAKKAWGGEAWDMRSTW
jgi:hypothetical protein